MKNEAELYLLAWKNVYEIIFSDKQVHEIAFLV